MLYLLSVLHRRQVQITVSDILWAAIVGTDVAALSRIARTSGSALVIETADGATSHMLSFLEREILEKVRALGLTHIERLRFRVSDMDTAGWCALCEEPNGCPHGHSDEEWTDANRRLIAARRAAAQLSRDNLMRMIYEADVPPGWIDAGGVSWDVFLECFGPPNLQTGTAGEQYARIERIADMMLALRANEPTQRPRCLKDGLCAEGTCRDCAAIRAEAESRETTQRDANAR